MLAAIKDALVGVALTRTGFGSPSSGNSSPPATSGDVPVGVPRWSEGEPTTGEIVLVAVNRAGPGVPVTVPRVGLAVGRETTVEVTVALSDGVSVAVGPTGAEVGGGGTGVLVAGPGVGVRVGTVPSCCAGIAQATGIAATPSRASASKVPHTIVLCLVVIVPSYW